MPTTDFRFDAAISSAVKNDPPVPQPRQSAVKGPLSPALLDRMQRYWDAANYLTIGQIYLRDN
ncbi:MAG: hypothetical protein M3Z19_08750, partial [Chloroflexota bacterium]|nr:hypothetical protein [Chloroflexota bacterium]